MSFIVFCRVFLSLYLKAFWAFKKRYVTCQHSYAQCWLDFFVAFSKKAIDFFRWVGYNSHRAYVFDGQTARDCFFLFFYKTTARVRGGCFLCSLLFQKPILLWL